MASDSPYHESLLIVDMHLLSSGTGQSQSGEQRLLVVVVLLEFTRAWPVIDDMFVGRSAADSSGSVVYIDPHKRHCFNQIETLEVYTWKGERDDDMDDDDDGSPCFLS